MDRPGWAFFRERYIDGIGLVYGEKQKNIGLKEKEGFLYNMLNHPILLRDIVAAYGKQCYDAGWDAAEAYRQIDWAGEGDGR